MDNLRKELAKTLHHEIHEMHDVSDFLLDDEKQNDAEAQGKLDNTAKNVFKLLSMLYNLGN